MSPTPSTAKRSHRPWQGFVVFGTAMLAVFLMGLFFASIMERRREAHHMEVLQPIAALESDPAKWRANYPRQYDSYLRTRETEAETKYGGPAFRDYLEETPANVILFAGIAFSRDYNQARGHYWARRDTLDTGRLAPDNPGTCWTCKSSDVPRVMAELGAGLVDDPENASFRERLMAGAAPFYATNFHELTPEMNHTIGCLNCHDPETMSLRITRPALVEAFERREMDIDEVSHQEMRSLVCAQCHVEYYFRGENDYLTLPWDQGTTVEDMERHFDEYEFADYTHAISGAPIIKIQHPDYELYQRGIHAYRSVSCADCHMPYKTEGGVKYSDHHLQSPLLSIDNSCAVCHRWSETEIRVRVESIQDKIKEGRERAERALALAHFDVAAAAQAGADDAELARARELLRGSQVRWDFVAAAKGMGFHAPQEAQRILTAAVELAQEARLEAGRLLAGYGYTAPVAYPAFETKEQAQALVQRFTNGDPPSLLVGGAGAHP